MSSSQIVQNAVPRDCMAVASKACALPGAVSARAIETIPQQCNDPWIAEVAWDNSHHHAAQEFGAVNSKCSLMGGVMIPYIRRRTVSSSGWAPGLSALRFSRQPVS